MQTSSAATVRKLKGLHGFQYAKYLVNRYERKHNIFVDDISEVLSNLRIKRAAAVALVSEREIKDYFGLV